MNRRVFPAIISTLYCFMWMLSGWAVAQTPTAKQALQLEPMQPNVDYDLPSGEAVEQCRIAAEDHGGHTAWVVRGPGGELLRQFVDSNGDNKVDQWRYCKGGVEVYRDIDHDYNGKADQYRWLSTAGTRWGLDGNEDGEIDSWKRISAEEVSSQVIEAIKARDKQRFRNVLLSPAELDSLGLGEQLSQSLADRIQSALTAFEKSLTSQSRITERSEWIDFGGLRPGTIPAGTDGSTKDVTVYENVVAMVETDGRTSQIPIGTLIQVGDGWRVVDLPFAAGDDATPQFVFFEAASHQSLDEAAAGISEQTQELVDALEKIDARLTTTRNTSLVAELNEQRADTLERLAKTAARATDQEMWWMQFADTVSAAAQTGTYPAGTKRLGILRRELESSSTNKDLIAHVTFAHMSADYAEQLQQEDADFAEVQENWLKQLESFVRKFSQGRNTAEAMLQLALAQEFAGEEEDANRWYTKIVRDFGDSPHASKAAGAKNRLESVGKQISLQGRTVQGKPFDLARLKGNTVLLHYWATWCEPCKQDMEILKKLAADFKREKFEIVGVNLDSQPEEASKFFRTERPVGTHLYEPGGLDSRLANEMGVFTLPVMLLIDKQGRVVNRQVHGVQLKSEIQKLLR